MSPTGPTDRRPANAAIVGAGQAGAAIGHGLVRAGVPVVGVASRTPESAHTLAGVLGTTAGDAGVVATAAAVVFVTTSDDAIRSVVDGLAAEGALRQGQSILHCSGVVGLDALDAAVGVGARTGVLHPVTPLVRPDATETLSGKPMGCDAHGDAAWVRDLALLLGGVPVDLHGVDRRLYHAAACMAANLVVAMCATAEEVLGDAGVDADGARALVASLVTSSAGNVAASGPSTALTGPVRRGDAGVVRAHLEALAARDPDIADVYRVVSRRILTMMPEGDKRDRMGDVLA